VSDPRAQAAPTTAAGQNKLHYVLLMVFPGALGSLIHVLVARPAPKAVGGI